MNSLITVIFILFVVILSFNAVGAEIQNKQYDENIINSEETFNIFPDLLKGKWICLSHSYDNGVNYDSGYIHRFCLVINDNIKFGQSEELFVEAIVKSKDYDGKEIYYIGFKDSTTSWRVTSKGYDFSKNSDGKIIWLLQTYNYRNKVLVESVRYLIKIYKSKDEETSCTVEECRGPW